MLLLPTNLYPIKIINMFFFYVNHAKIKKGYKKGA